MKQQTPWQGRLGQVLMILILVTLFSCAKEAPVDTPDDITDTTQFGRGRGALMPVDSIIEKVKTFSDVELSILPASNLLQPPIEFSLLMPPVGDQFEFNSCVGWAAAYSAFSCVVRKNSRTAEFGPTNLMSPTFVWNSLNMGQNLSISLLDALAFMQHRGTCLYQSMPYLASYKLLPNENQINEAQSFKLSGYLRFSDSSTILQVKNFLVEYQIPIVFGLQVDASFAKPKEGFGFRRVSNGRLVYESYVSPKRDGHALVICGYDDEINAFKVMNSWGTGWANSGYVWIDYNFFMQVVSKSTKGYLDMYALLSYSASDINKDLLAYYTFNRDTRDFSINNYDSRAGGSPDLRGRVLGVRGNAGSLTGKCTTGSCEGEEGGHILLPDLGLAQRKKFTINMWVNETRMEIHDGEAYIFFGNHETGMIEISHLSDRLYFSVSKTTSVSVPFDYGDIGKFVMYSLVYDDGVMRAYRNAALLGESTGPVQVTDTTAAIGRHWWWSTSTRFTGAIDEVKIFSAALSPAQLKKLYDNP